MKKILFVAFVLFFLQGCFYLVRYEGTYKGKVIDEATEEPLEGVVILATWYREYATPAGAIYKYYDARETVTDKNGEFSLSSMGLKVLSNVWPKRITIFKAGYLYETTSWEIEKEIGRWEGNRVIIPLKKLTTMEERRRNMPSSPPHEAPLKKVILMLKEIDKARIEIGWDARKIWRGESYE